MLVEKNIDIEKNIEKNTETGIRFVSGYSDEVLPVWSWKQDDSLQPSEINERVTSFYHSVRDASAYDPGFLPDGMLFYKQACMMADYDDDDEPGGDERFERYYPRYRDMTERQLQSYFRLRTRLRRREHISVSCLSYVYLYCYELIACVGVPDAESGLKELKWLRDEFSSLNEEFGRNLTGWCRDFCIYYDIHGEETRGLFPDAGDDPVAVLERYVASRDDRTGVSEEDDEKDVRYSEKDAEAFRAISEVTGECLSRSSYYRENQTLVERTVTRAYMETDRFLKERGKKGVQELCFGTRGSFTCRLFRSAPFYDRLKREDYIYEVNPVCRYRCSKTGWARETYYRSEQTSSELKAICQEADRVLRDLTGYLPALKKKISNESIAQVIRCAAETVLREEREAARPKLTLDMSILSGIRKDADQVRDSLIVEEDTALQDVYPETEPAAALPEIQGLDDISAALLRIVLDGGDAAAFSAERKISLAVTIDRINEALYDMLGDTALEFEGDTPVVVEDYRRELEALFTEGDNK